MQDLASYCEPAFTVLDYIYMYMYMYISLTTAHTIHQTARYSVFR